MKRKLSIIACSIALLVTAALWLSYTIITSCRPAMPDKWHQLRPGMARPEVLSIVGTDTFDARDIKGFETTGVDTSMGGMSSYWAIFLRYDTSERLTSADALFVNRVTGLFSTDELSVFP